MARAPGRSPEREFKCGALGGWFPSDRPSSEPQSEINYVVILARFGLGKEIYPIPQSLVGFFAFEDNEIGFTNEFLSCIKVGFTGEIARAALSATDCFGCNKVGLQLVGNVFGIDLGNMGGIVTARLCGKRFLGNLIFGDFIVLDKRVSPEELPCHIFGKRTSDLAARWGRVSNLRISMTHDNGTGSVPLHSCGKLSSSCSTLGEKVDCALVLVSTADTHFWCLLMSFAPTPCQGCVRVPSLSVLLHLRNGGFQPTFGASIWLWKRQLVE
ncbi:hypothetical protein Cgig2_020447 [Carnegiea gigantea]|uniref:Uncharacterized protein n=1 Tax=Carnegiea gigantea TaxID=171969 RepID=A0A9Q1JYX9_9CARY|nr:hypothetical protein Cgig2_020447 [Carnegiea gigantea]